MMNPRRIVCQWWSWLRLAVGLTLCGVSACSPGATILDVLANSTASLGRPINADGTTDDTAGRRGNINIVFVNNTPYRAVFTFGTYDPLNTDQAGSAAFPIKWRQFFVDDQTAANRLDALSESQKITFAGSGAADDPGGCGRAISIGHAELIDLIEANKFQTSSSSVALHPEALRPVCDAGQAKAGIAFFSETSTGPAENACESVTELVGWAEGIQTLQGAKYPCNALLIYTFDEAGTWPGGKKKFTVELTQVILP